MARGTKLTPEQVIDLREHHEHVRAFRRNEETGETMSDKDIDTKVALEFGVSVTHVRDIVLGVTHADVGGPRDVARQKRVDLYSQERTTLGETEARRRMNLRLRGVDPEPKAVRWSQRAVILDSKGRETGMAYTLEPGQSIRVELVAEGGNR